MNKPPAFQFYADDFLAGTQKFTDAECGLYVRLLCAQWSEGGLPDDNHELSSYGRGDTSVERVRAKFKKGPDGLLRNERLELEREKQRLYRESRSKNGSFGGRPPKPHGSDMVSTNKSTAKAQKSSPSPSPSPSTEIPPIPPNGAGVHESKKPEIDVIPEALNNPEFKSAWGKWHEHLKQKRKPATIHARDLQLAKLAKLGSAKAIEAISHSIEHNWQGIYEPTNGKSTTNPRDRSFGIAQSGEDKGRETVEILRRRAMAAQMAQSGNPSPQAP